ncbi:MAG: hypothetical protein PHU81_00910 [Acidobacteriota bacterium]|nr:hypothetical protein [Acidobacteriota bacterium]
MKKILRLEAAGWRMFIITFIFFLAAARSLAADEKISKALKAGEEKAGTWWMKQTAMSTNGRLISLKSKKWWKKALALEPGESFIIQERGEAKDRMLVRAEAFQADDGYLAEVLTWIIDDDANGSLLTGGDYSQDCYLYDLNRDGLVEVMIDYVDEDDDGQADFMEIRLYERGYLSLMWGGYDYEKIGEIFKFRTPFDLISGNFFKNLTGDKLYFKNVFNPLTGTFWPADLCPLASYDLDQDGLSDLVIRSHVQPAVSKDNFIEPVNSWLRELKDPVIKSLEISFDLAGENSQEKPFDYDVGLLQAGSLPFDLESARNFSPLRRPPQEVYFISRENLKALAFSYSPQAVGFSWQEFSTSSAAGATSSLENLGEGVGWLPERVRLPGSSSYLQKWNIRREVAPDLIGPVEFYYSELDQKIHLFGSKEGWCQIGNMAGCPGLGEIRYFDTDQNGFFDRQEIYLINSSRPVLIISSAWAKVRKIPFDLQHLQEFYKKEVLPAAFDRDHRLLTAMKEVYKYEPPAGLLAGIEAAPENEKRYLLDVYCLLYFINLRDHYLTLANQILFQTDIRPGQRPGDLDPSNVRSPREVGSFLKSDTAWQLARLISRLDQAWSRVDLASILQVLREIKSLEL